MVPAQLEFVDGVPYSRAYGDVYHSTSGGVAQARHVFLNGNRVAERWARRERFVILESVFFDRAGKELKRSRAKDYRQLQGKWRAHNIEMSNAQTGRKTIIATAEYQLGLDLSDRLFSVDQLRKN